MFNEYGFVSWEERLWAHSNGLIPGMVERLGMGWLYSF